MSATDVFRGRAASDAEFAARLKAAAPHVAEFDFKAHGLVLAGGAASALLMRKGASFYDMDLFLVGHADDSAALAAITAIGDHLYCGIEGLNMTVYRTLGCVTFYRPGVIVQVILRRYSTVGEVIHGFDLGSCAMAWDGARVYLTGLGKLAAECGANVLNLAARRSSYESRLARYFERKFDIYLPNLDAGKLVANGGRLPYLHALRLSNDLTAMDQLVTARPEWIKSTYIRRVKKAQPPAGDDVETSDYGFGQLHYGDPCAVYARNVCAAGCEPARIASLCGHAEYCPGLDVRTVGFDIGDHSPLVELVGRTFGMNFRLPGLECGDGAVKMKTLKSYLGADLTASLVMEFISSGKPPPKASIELVCAKRIAELQGRRCDIPFAFMGVEENTALTGPFPRNVIGLAEWYGDAYCPDPAE